ncbi:fluoride efflux transporter CrcB [Rhizobium sp. PAMB 3182]
MTHILLAALGGAFGSVLRYLVGNWTFRLFGPSYPWGTMTVNVVGSFVIGLFAELVARKLNSSPELRVLLITGFLGGFTTFSAFSLDAFTLYERGELALAGVYVIGSVVISLCAVSGGLMLGRAVF